MKDLPTTLRLVILVALLLSLAVILRQLFAESTDAQRFEIVASSSDDSESKPDPLPNMPVLYPPVPAVLPDLSDGYLFNGARLFEKVEEDMTSSSAGSVDLAEVSYAGSLIVGEIQKALVSYLDNSPATRRTSGSRGVVAKTNRTSATGASRYVQLMVGEKFMGYVVEKIEIDRIVFRKGDDMVERFLYDQNKDRAVIVSEVKELPAEVAEPPAAATVDRSVSPSPTRRAVVSPPPVSGPRTGVPSRLTRSAPGAKAPSAAKLRRIQMEERLLGLDPSLGTAPSSGVSGDPLRR